MPPHPPLRAAAVLVAAGSSRRMQGGERKPFRRLGGQTVIELAAGAFDALEEVLEVVIVGRSDDLERLRELASSRPLLRKVTAVVPGGEERSDSVRLGLAAVSPACELVCIHDAARPLLLPETVRRALEVAAREGAAVVALAVSDTIKVSPDGERAERTLDRSTLWAAQTPQVFRAARLRELLERAAAEGFRPTDDSALWERYVGPVPIVPGRSDNLKVTTPEDLALAAALLKERERA